MHRVVIEFNTGANFQIGILLPQPLNLIEPHPLMVAIVIGEREITQPATIKAMGRKNQFIKRLYASEFVGTARA